MWRSLVARLLWEQDVAGSNPVIPTKFDGVIFCIEQIMTLFLAVRFGHAGERAHRFAFWAEMIWSC